MNLPHQHTHGTGDHHDHHHQSHGSLHHSLTMDVRHSNKDLDGVDDFISALKQDVPEKGPNSKAMHHQPAGRSYSPKPIIEEDYRNTGGSVAHKLKHADDMANAFDPNVSYKGTMAYGINRKKGKSPLRNERAEMYYDYQKENLALKEKENLLEREITKMKTKLARIEALIRKNRTYTDKDFQSLHQELDDHVNTMRDENEMLREKTRKLKTIAAGLESQYKSIAAGKQKKPGVRPKTAQGKKPFDRKCYGQSEKLIEELRKQLVDNEKHVVKLYSELDKYHTSGNMTHDQILKHVKDRDGEVLEIQAKYEELEMGFIRFESMFKGAKENLDQVMTQTREQRIQNETLRSKNLKLQIASGSASDLTEQLRMLQTERDHIEKNIKRLTTDPFIKQGQGQTNQQRLIQLQQKLADKEKVVRGIKDEETKKQAEVTKLKSDYLLLKGEKDFLEKENKKARGKFSDTNNLEEFNVNNTLFKMDPKKYVQTLGDLSINQEQMPIWAKLDFLEREQEQIDPNNIQQLKGEINKLRQENKDFAAELEKAQNLLKLQRDIESDNTHYFEQERKRLDIIYRSTSSKAEELARRADDKLKQIQDMTHKLGFSRSRIGSPDKSQLQTASAFGKHLDDMETMSDFSVLSNESEIRQDSNCLDFVIQDAEFYFDSFSSILDEKELILHQRTLITFVTIDFYNHDTETSQISEGLKPIYQTQFSFKNKVDDFYVQHLMKQNMKIDVYISKNNHAIHLGRGEVMLKELVERETALSELAIRTPVIEKAIRLYAVRPNSNGENIPIGTLRYKMRMRKPISEAMRFFREKNELTTMTLSNFDQNKSRKRVVSISVVNCMNLTMKYSQVVKIAPFFYFQFYTFDERYSKTSSGTSPVFEDHATYEVTFDNKFMSYLEQESLDIIFFDDNAPIQGVDRGGKMTNEAQGNEDMIGIAKIPLSELVKGAAVNGRFPIRNSKRENCGTVEININMMDAEFMPSESGMGIKQGLPYNKQWETDVIYKIALKLAKFPVETIELLFGIFARGQKTVTKEDFKYQVLNRLQMKNDLTDKELEIFLKSCMQIRDRDYLDAQDFRIIFEAAISQARHDLQNQEAIQNQTVHKYNELMRSFDKSGGGMGDLSKSMKVDVYELQIVELLQKLRRGGNVELMLQMIRQWRNSDDTIDSKQLITCLCKEGALSQYDSAKITQFLEISNKVNVTKFEVLLGKALEQDSKTSKSLHKFNQLIVNKGESLSKKFKDQDKDRDGSLNIDGFIAVLLLNEYHFSKTEAQEVFQILNKNGYFRYSEYLIHQNPQLRVFFHDISTGSLSISDNTHIAEKSNKTTSLQSLKEIDETKIRAIKNKIKSYIEHQDISLSTLFNLLDVDSSKSIEYQEFVTRLKGMNITLEEDEYKMLFRSIDKDGGGTISVDEFFLEFADLNVAYMIKKLKERIVNSGVPPESFFETSCTDKKQWRMTEPDFKALATKHFGKIRDIEAHTFYQHFDQSRKGYITKDEFKAAFGREVSEMIFKIGIEDIIKPLATKIMKERVNVSTLFDKYDKNHNGKLSGEELAHAFKVDMNVVLEQDEIHTIKEYIMNKFRTSEIRKADFISLIEQKFERNFEPEAAKKSLQTLKAKLQNINKSTLNYFSMFDAEKTQHLTLRNFKVALNGLKALNQYEIDNLAKYLDKENDGFIGMNDLDSCMKGQVTFASTLQKQNTGHNTSMSSTTGGGKRTEKWGK